MTSMLSILVMVSYLKMKALLVDAREEGIIFIGPKIKHLNMFGDKVNARASETAANPNDSWF